jgi:hypothetical protein
VTYSIYWINPTALVHTQSDPSSADVLPSLSRRDTTMVTAGWGATLVWESDITLRLWRCKRGFPPLRIAKRNDGNGIAERSSRIRTAGKETSSSDDSNRLSPQGRGLYR